MVNCTYCIEDIILAFPSLLMESENSWFTFDDPDNLFVEADKNKFLYRIISFDILLQMLNEKQLVLVSTQKWEDLYK